MNRLQVSLTEDQYEFLKSEAFVKDKSMAAVLRELLDEVIQAKRQDLLQNDPIWQIIGVGAEVDGPTDISGNVDKYLYGERVETTQAATLRKVAEDSNEYDAD